MAEGDGVIRVLLADEQSLFRQAVKVVLSNEDDLIVVGEAADGLQAIAEVERVRPVVALLDAGLPNCDGIVRRNDQPGSRLSRSSSSARKRTNSCSSGVGGRSQRVPLEGFPIVDLIEATRAVHQGDALIRRMLGALLQRLIPGGASA